jgi:two-component system NtrC family response regulator
MLAMKVGILGHQAEQAQSLAQGLTLAGGGPHDVVFLDVRLPDGSGLEIVRDLRESPGRPEVIIMTGAGDPDGAELAVKSGAWDYITKPSTIQAMTLPLMRALQYRSEREASPRAVALRREGITGEGPAMRAALDLLAQAAHSELAVLLMGETGTGKELFARAIHDNSPRRQGPLVVVDCSALPETLVESILFGHERGAYTGAHEARLGLVAQAHEGSLFLDEVGELPLVIQKSFLRVLQDKRFRPLGGKQELASDFRLIAATNRDLDAMAGAGQFRSDLLHRLRGLVIPLPPLRARPEDLRALASHHLERLGARYGSGAKGFAPEFMQALTSYSWPGNVRELVNTLEQALAAAGEAPTLFPRHLPEHLRVALARATAGEKDAAALTERQGTASAFGAAPAGPAPGGLPTLQEFRRAGDRQYLRELMALSRGEVAEACRLSGLSRSRLYDLLRQYGLTGAGRGAAPSHKQD